ncbi:sugar transferase [Prochlorococcus sp. MIT 1223]|uniref:sugar transferase n=1 Tax=Prochlorococcus sp. MIT 1223 TaxID=3096217 RepID=UPI002A754A37|nr:sugar transferase [Prochlorococcus sp. MIT 1223]
MYCLFKEFIDRVSASILFIIFIPIYILISLIVFIDLGNPIFFKQSRPGLKGKLFTLIKFRTMQSIKSKDVDLISDSSRTSKVGKFLRKTSLDELPELINIINGKMSFVGPRPLLIEYLDLYSPEQMRRHNVKPGLSGWAQVNGRNSISWEKKFKLDLWYIKNQSFLLDIKILFLTMIRVIRMDSIYSDGESINTHFKGHLN